MPRYSFSLKVGSNIVDGGAGIELPDAKAALAHAWIIGRTLLDFPERGADWADGFLIIEDNRSRSSFTLSLSEVAERRQHLLTH